MHFYACFSFSLLSSTLEKLRVLYINKYSEKFLNKFMTVNLIKVEDSGKLVKTGLSGKVKRLVTEK